MVGLIERIARVDQDLLLLERVKANRLCLVVEHTLTTSDASIYDQVDALRFRELVAKLQELIVDDDTWPGAFQAGQCIEAASPETMKPHVLTAAGYLRETVKMFAQYCSWEFWTAQVTELGQQNEFKVSERSTRGLFDRLTGEFRHGTTIPTRFFLEISRVLSGAKALARYGNLYVLQRDRDEGIFG